MHFVRNTIFKCKKMKNLKLFTFWVFNGLHHNKNNNNNNNNIMISYGILKTKFNVY